MSALKTLLLSFLLVDTTLPTLVRYDLIIRAVPGSPDGYPRRVITTYINSSEAWDVDRPFPGPLIRATKGDILEIHITNYLADQSTSIHFHGVHMLNNPWMDGVDMITQCPILSQESFVYKFNVTQTGTFWYHSHYNQQYSDGLLGPIIFDYPSCNEDPICSRFAYKCDHTLTIQEWYHETWPDVMTAYLGPHGAYPDYKARYPWPSVSVLINGHGHFNCQWENCSDHQVETANHLIEGEDNNCTEGVQCVPLRPSYYGPCITNKHQEERFFCPANETIRLRLISAASQTRHRFWIEKHSFFVVARDSVETEPLELDLLRINAGQRIDIVVRCNQDSQATYKMWVVLGRPTDDGPYPLRWMSALLVYNETMVNSTLTPPENMTGQPTDFSSEFSEMKPLITSPSPPAIRRITLSFDVIWNDTDGQALEEWEINNRTFRSSQINGGEPILQSLYYDGKPNLKEPFEGPLGNIYDIPIEYLEYGEVYEVLIINDDSQQHPWHIHGYTVDFIQVGILNHTLNFSCPDDTKYYLNRYTNDCHFTNYSMSSVNFDDVLHPFNESSPILSRGDSFTVPKKGYVTFRFKADNPGPWFFHCHMEYHISPGLAMVFIVRDEKHGNGMLSPPPINEFPVCGEKYQRWTNFKKTEASSRSMVFNASIRAVFFFLFIFFIAKNVFIVHAL